MSCELKNPQWKTAPIRGVLFDMDGVILDTEKLYTRFWQEALNALGFPMTREQALGMRSLNREAGAAKLQSYFGPTADHSAARAKRIELMNAYVQEHGVELKPGIRELLDHLHARGIRTAIATSSPTERVLAYLEPHGLSGSFDAICSAYQVPKSKPAPDIYLFAASSLRLSPEECLAIEDSDAGILSAYRAKCLPVMVPDQDIPAAETLPRLYAKADSLFDIINLL